MVDGTGAPPFAADVAVEGDTLRMLPAGTPAQAERVIHASGHIVAPGFVDIHTHAALRPFLPDGMAPFYQQGVTTAVVGLDGLSTAPFRSAARRNEALELLEGSEGSNLGPTQALNVAAYLDAVDKRSACNVATMVGNGTLRLAAMRWTGRAPNSDELDAMARLLDEAMEQGALGLSSGLTYPPSSYAQRGELARLCAVVRRYSGRYVAHLRAGAGDGLLDPLREALETARDARVVAHITQLASARPGGADKLCGLMESARREGLDATFDVNPYPFSGAPLAAYLPAWVFEGGLGALRRRVQDRRERARIVADQVWHARDCSALLVTNLTHKRYAGFDGWPLESIAQALEHPVASVVCDLIAAEGLRPAVVSLGGNPVNIRRLLADPSCMVASGGAPLGDHCNPRAFGTFPTVLGGLSRDEGVLTIQEAVRRMTSLPAKRLGLRDRGQLWNGLKADVAVFDPERVDGEATLRDPRAPPRGVAWVIVNGTPVRTPEGPTGATPGRGLRRTGPLPKAA